VQLRLDIIASALTMMGQFSLGHKVRCHKIAVEKNFPERYTCRENKAREGHDFSRAALSWPESGFSR
jgi:hypothetical protein